jgi:hypothetical protein
MKRGLFLMFLVVIALTAPVGSGWAQDLSVDDEADVEVDGDDGDAEIEACERLPWGSRSLCAGVSDAFAFGVQPIVAGGVQAVLDEMVAFVVDGAGWLLDQVASFLETSTRPQLTSSWFERAYQDMTAVAVFGLLPFLLLAIVQGIVRQDAALLLRATFAYVPLAAIGTAGAVVVVDLLVQLTDLLSAWMGRTLGADLADFSTGLGQAMLSMPAASGGPVAGLAALLAAGVIAFAAFAIWLELLLRQAAIYVAVLFLPLGFMAMVWPATAHWLRRLVQGLIAIILSKFVIVAVMALAASALSAQAPEEGFTVVLAGASLLSLAALAPYVLLRLIPVFESGLSGDLEGTYRRPTAAVASPTAGSHMLQAVRQRAGGGASSSGGDTPASSAGGGQAAPASGGPSGSPGSTPTTTAGTAGSGGAAGSGASGSGGAAGSGTSTGGVGTGGGAATGVGVGGGVIAAGVGTVAAGAGGAKKVGEHLQRHGTDQQAATAATGAGSRPDAPQVDGGPPPAGAPRQPPRPAPPTSETSSSARPSTRPSPRSQPTFDDAGRRRPPQEP